MDMRISSGLLEHIMAMAAATEAEICGLLLGLDGLVTDIQPAANVAPDPRRHFEIDPAVLIAAHRAARQGGPAILGHYHSHPGGVARPSATDAAGAVPDGALWLIVAGDRAHVSRAVPDGLGATVFRPVQLVVTDQAGLASSDGAEH